MTDAHINESNQKWDEKMSKEDQLDESAKEAAKHIVSDAHEMRCVLERLAGNIDDVTLLMYGTDMDEFCGLMCKAIKTEINESAIEEVER